MLPGKTLTPRDFLQIARRRAWLVAIPPVVSLFAALLYSSTVPNLYQSDMLIRVDPQRVPDAFVRSTVTLTPEARLDAISVQVLSRTTLERLITELSLYPDERRTQPMEDVVAGMLDNTDVEMERSRPGPRGMEPPAAFHVRFTYHDPNVAARVTERLGMLFVSQNAGDRQAMARKTSEFLDAQLEESRKSLEVQERRLEAFRERHGKELPTQMQSNMQAIATAQMQVQGLVESIARDRDRKLMLERLYREAANEPSVAAAPVPAVASGGALVVGATARQQLESARANLAALELRYTTSHPDVVRARRQIAELEPKAAAEAAAETSEGSSATPAPAISATEAARRERLRQMLAEIESLDRLTAFKESEERRMRAEIAEYQRRIEAVPGLESEYAALSRDYDTQQAAYKELLTKSGAARLAVDLEQEQIGEHFRIVDPANVPVHPLSSLRPQINAGGLALGLLFGIGLAVLLELRDTSFKSDDDVLEVLQLPVLAAVPLVMSEVEKRRQRQRVWALAAAGVVAVGGLSYATWALQLWNFLI